MNEKDVLVSSIKKLLREKEAVLVSHFYTDPDIQKITDETEGLVGDSLEMARFGATNSAKTLVVSGVRFMGETAKILSPTKRVLMPTLKAECSLDLGCPREKFAEFCKEHKDRTVVVYVNCSAAIKALADWTVTSSSALKIVEYLHNRGEKILWAPDKYLGDYIQKKTNADMILWNGSCIVHEKFKAEGIKELKKQYPDAAVLVHPESPPEVIALADQVGSTTQIIKAAETLPNKTFIIATDIGIFYKLKQRCHDKTFLPAPTFGVGATCQSCAHCPWMAMNNLVNLEESLRTGNNEIQLEPEIITRARIPLQRMLDFTKKYM